MTDNPYEPPQTDVRDALPVRLVAERPRQVLHAIALFWVSAGLGLAAGLSEAQRTAEPWGMMAFMVVMTLGLLGVLTVALWRGRRWARVLYAVLVALSLVAFLSSWGTTERTPIEVALEAVSFVADGGSFVLMFTRPGSLWFRYSGERSASQ